MIRIFTMLILWLIYMVCSFEHKAFLLSGLVALPFIIIYSTAILERRYEK